MSLGGSIFTHNVMRFDYCFRESIACLAELCDEVVVLDAESDDGTLDELRAIAARLPNVRLVEGATWDCAPKHERLAVLANQARSYLKTPWHFMLQADEVVHEKSFGAIRTMASAPKGHESFACRRWNLFGDFDHHVSLYSAKKPCSDSPIRLARTHLPAVGDAESILAHTCDWHHVADVEIFHYGLVRKFDALLDKTIDMQTWFHGVGQADPRCVDMKATGAHDPYRLIAKEELARLEGTHPKWMAAWIAEREEEKRKWKP